MADQATLQAWLTAAEAARHDLAIGVREVSISSSSGKSVSYNQANAGQLDAYIAYLQRQLKQSTNRPFTFRIG
jgi:hypothetical protein